MKCIKTTLKFLILLPKLLSFSTLFFMISCHSNKQTNDQQFEDFRFKKIHSLINDSTNYFRAIDSVYADLSDFRRLYETYNTKRGYFYTYKRDYVKSLLYADSALLLLSDHKNEEGYKLWYPQALSLKADDLHALKRYSEAFTYYYLAREAIYLSGNTCLYTDYSSKLGMVSYRHKHYKEAITYFKQAIEQEQGCNKEKDIYNESLQFAHHQSNLDNIGICYSKLGIYDSAVFYYDSALSYINLNAGKAFKYDKNNNKISDTDFVASTKGVVFGNLGTVYQSMGIDSVAETLLKQSIAINSKPYRAIEDVPYSQSKLADLYIAQTRCKEAGEILKDLKQLLDTVPNAEILQKWYSMQAELASKEKNYEAANNYLAVFITIKDSLNAIERERLAIDINQTFTFLKSQNDLFIFKRDDERKGFYLLLMGIAAITVLAVSLLIWKNYRQSKKHLNVLGGLNNQLQTKQNHLERTLGALQSSHDDNTRLMKIVAHDLRNPVSGIAGMSDFLLKEDNYNELQRKMLEMIQESSYHSLELIHELVNINSTVSDVKKAPIDLSLLINYCVEMLQIKADEKNQKIKADVVAVKIIGDREKLWRVFANLLGNAVKFSATAKEIEVSVTVKDNRAIIGIKDNGIGIPIELSEKIFKMDPDVKRKGTSGETSFGLGLAICKQIITNHDGNIWFVSEENKGTVFYVSLPIAA